MKKAQKWNPLTRSYSPIEIDDRCQVYSNNLEEVVVCPHCGKELPWGECYTSKQIHTQIGFSYGVCSQCYEKEWHEEQGTRRFE